MASLTRRMQIRGMKRRGFRRTKVRIVAGEERLAGIDHNGGSPLEREIPVARGGMILNPEGERVGYHWPRSVVV